MTFYPNNTMSDEENHAHFNEHAPLIVELLNKSGKAFFGDKAPSVVHDPNEPLIRIDNGMIDIMPGVHEQKRIGGPERYLYSPAFDVVKYKIHYATRWEPEDAEDITIETVCGAYNVAQSALVNWFKESAGGWFDAEGEAASYAEMESMEQINEFSN